MSGPGSISVVIPAYNASRYLAETLQSVLDQTLAVAEVLVVDDGSTDNTAEVAERFAPRVKVFRRPNGKQAVARNFGVDQAAGEWIAFVDADDVWEPNKLELQMAELQRNPKADICYTGTVWLMQEGETARLGEVQAVAPADKIRDALLREVSFLPSSVVMRRSVFLSVGRFDPGLIYGNEDHDLWLRLRRAGIEFAMRPEPLVRYRRHGSNTVCHQPWFEECTSMYRRQALPDLPKLTGWYWYNVYRSGQEAEAAYALRRLGDSKHLRFMAASLVHRPFHEPNRYKVFAHMLYTRLRRLL